MGAKADGNLVGFENLNILTTQALLQYRTIFERLITRRLSGTSRHCYRLVGFVVKASASRAEDPGFESGLPRDFSGVESYQ